MAEPEAENGQVPVTESVELQAITDSAPEEKKKPEGFTALMGRSELIEPDKEIFRLACCIRYLHWKCNWRLSERLLADQDEYSILKNEFQSEYSSYIAPSVSNEEEEHMIDTFKGEGQYLRRHSFWSMLHPRGDEAQPVSTITHYSVFNMNEKGVVANIRHGQGEKVDISSPPNVNSIPDWDNKHQAQRYVEVLKKLYSKKNDGREDIQAIRQALFNLRKAEGFPKPRIKLGTYTGSGYQENICAEFGFNIDNFLAELMFGGETGIKQIDKVVDEQLVIDKHKDAIRRKAFRDTYDQVATEWAAKEQHKARLGRRDESGWFFCLLILIATVSTTIIWLYGYTGEERDLYENVVELQKLFHVEMHNQFNNMVTNMIGGMSSISLMMLELMNKETLDLIQSSGSTFSDIQSNATQMYTFQKDLLFDPKHKIFQENLVLQFAAQDHFDSFMIHSNPRDYYSFALSSQSVTPNISATPWNESDIVQGSPYFLFFLNKTTTADLKSFQHAVQLTKIVNGVSYTVQDLLIVSRETERTRIKTNTTVLNLTNSNSFDLSSSTLFRSNLSIPAWDIIDEGSVSGLGSSFLYHDPGLLYYNPVVLDTELITAYSMGFISKNKINKATFKQVSEITECDCEIQTLNLDKCIHERCPLVNGTDCTYCDVARGELEKCSKCNVINDMTVSMYSILDSGAPDETPIFTSDFASEIDYEFPITYKNYPSNYFGPSTAVYNESWNADMRFDAAKVKTGNTTGISSISKYSVFGKELFYLCVGTTAEISSKIASANRVTASLAVLLVVFSILIVYLVYHDDPEAETVYKIYGIKGYWIRSLVYCFVVLFVFFLWDFWFISAFNELQKITDLLISLNQNYLFSSIYPLFGGLTSIVEFERFYQDQVVFTEETRAINTTLLDEFTFLYYKKMFSPDPLETVAEVYQEFYLNNSGNVVQNFTTHDTFFRNILASFLDQDQQFRLEYAYAGFETGNFVGAKIITSESDPNGGNIIIGAKDELTPCYSQFNEKLVSNKQYIRDITKLVPGTERCSYDPRRRVWYEDAKREGVTVYSNQPYVCNQQFLCMTVSVPIYDSVGDFYGAFGVDISFQAITGVLDDVSKFLHSSTPVSVRRTFEKGTDEIVFMTTSTFDMISSSKGQYYTQFTEESTISPLNAQYSEVPEIVELSSWLNLSNYEISCVDHSNIPRGIVSPFTSVSPLNQGGCTSRGDIESTETLYDLTSGESASYYLISMIPKHFYQGNAENRLIVTFIGCGFALVIYFYVINGFYSRWYLDDAFLTENPTEKVDLQRSLELIVMYIHGKVMKSSGTQWQYILNANDDPEQELAIGPASRRLFHGLSMPFIETAAGKDKKPEEDFEEGYAERLRRMHTEQAMVERKKHSNEPLSDLEKRLIWCDSYAQYIHMKKNKSRRTYDCFWNRAGALQHIYQMAASHLKSWQLRINSLDYMAIENLGYPEACKFYKFTKSSIYEIVILTAILIHIFLPFYEIVSNEMMQLTKLDRGNVICNNLSDSKWCLNLPWTVYIEPLILAVEFFHCFSQYLINFKWQEGLLFLRAEARIADIGFFICWLLSLVNWLCVVFGRFSFHYYVPFKPLLLVLYSTKVFDYMLMFFRTIWSSRTVFALYFCILVVCSAMALVLTRHIKKDPNAPFYSYITIAHSFLATFVYISTGENFENVYWPTMDAKQLFIFPYWLIMTFFVVFFVFAMTLGFFQNEFPKVENFFDQRRQILHNIGIIACFALLDVDRSLTLDREEISSLIFALRQRDLLEHDARYSPQPFGKHDILAAKATINEFKRNGFKFLKEQPDAASEHNNQFIHNLPGTSGFSDRNHRDLVCIKEIEVRQHLTFKSAETLFYIGGGIDGIYHSSYNDIELERSTYSVDQFVSMIKNHFNIEDFIGKIEFLGIKNQTQDNDIANWDKKGKNSMHQTDRFNFIVIFLHLMFLCFYGVLSEPESGISWLDFICILLCAIQIFYVLVLVINMGPVQFWYFNELLPYRVDPDSQFRQLAHRFDVLVFAVMFYGIIYAGIYFYAVHPNQGCVAKPGFLIPPTKENVLANIDLFDCSARLTEFMASIRFMLALPTVRIFTIVNRFRALILTLFKSFLKFGPFFWILFFVFYVYGVIGVTVFYNFEHDLSFGVPFGKFDSLADSVHALFQLLVQSSWYNILYGLMLSGGWDKALFAFSFMVVCTLLFKSLIIGLIMNQFSVDENEYMAKKNQYEDRLRGIYEKRKREKKKKLAEYAEKIHFSAAQIDPELDHDPDAPESGGHVRNETVADFDELIDQRNRAGRTGSVILREIEEKQEQQSLSIEEEQFIQFLLKNRDSTLDQWKRIIEMVESGNLSLDNVEKLYKVFEERYYMSQIS